MLRSPTFTSLLAMSLGSILLNSFCCNAIMANQYGIDLSESSFSGPVGSVPCTNVIVTVGILSHDPPQPAWKDFTTQNLVEHLRDQAHWMKINGSKQNHFLGYARDVVTRAAIELRDRVKPMPAIGSVAWRRLLIASRVLQIFINDPRHLVNNTELARVEDALVQFIGSTEPLWQDFNALDKSLQMFYRYHRKASLAEWMGMQLDGKTLYLVD